jgi:hypothetical protein
VSVYRYFRSARRRALQASIVLALAIIVIANLSLLKLPVSPGNVDARPLMTSDVHIMAAELIGNPCTLPVMRFEQIDGRYVPIADVYLNSFPDPLVRHYSASDIRTVGNAVDYYLAAGVVFIGFLAFYLFGLFGSLRDAGLRE